jgi:hypothetical protein
MAKKASNAQVKGTFAEMEWPAWATWALLATLATSLITIAATINDVW